MRASVTRLIHVRVPPVVHPAAMARAAKRDAHLSIDRIARAAYFYGVRQQLSPGLEVHMNSPVAAQRQAARSRLVLWCGDGSRQRVDVAAPQALPYAEMPADDSPASAAGWSRHSVLAVPIEPVDGGLGVLLVPDGGAPVAINGVAVPPGLHLLRHADRLDVAGRLHWVSQRCEVEHVEYDPAVHGDNVYCYLTKARLRPGQAIRICPGLAGSPCGALYTAEAWEMAMQSQPPMPCASCGYHRTKAEWSPPPARVRPREPLAHRLQRLVAARR
jgi:hypothetical protein